MHVIGTAGHVDHGKSSLVQRLTGIDPDRFEEEKRRGLTIDLGFAWFTLPSGTEIGLVDVPGHERFIKNMLAGAGGISICLFVVAANEGWKPQSAEHLSILHVLGVSAGVVAVTKSDLVDQETLELTSVQIQEELATSTLHQAPIVPCSVVSGEGIDDLVRELDRVVTSAPPVPDLGRPRLWVDRVFTISGAGTVVTGTMADGSIAVGDEVEVSPEGRPARIRKIQSYKREVPAVGPGTRVALNLAGLERQGAQRGDAVVRSGQWRPSRIVDAAVQVISERLIGTKHVLTEKGAHLLYVGSAETPVRLRLLDKDRIGPGESGYARLFLRDALPIGRGDRFVLRDAGRILTFGGGQVLDPYPSGRPRLDLLDRLVSATPDEALSALVETEGAVALDDALSRSGARSPVDEGMTRLDSMLVSPRRLQELVGLVGDKVRAYHSAHPLERGISKEVLRAETGLSPSAFERLLDGHPDVVSDGAIIRSCEHSNVLPPEEQRARDAILARVESGGMSPPLSSDLNAKPELLRALVAAGDLVKVGDFYITESQARLIRAKVHAAIEVSGPLTVAQIRDLLGTSRKYAVPLCEWLDAIGATRRQGDLRHRGPRA